MLAISLLKWLLGRLYLLSFKELFVTTITKPPEVKVNKSWKKAHCEGVRGQSVFFNWPLRERNLKVKLYLKVVLKS